ncbi:MAG: right-handed parallel beta-helix repeat-containing protein [Limisphaerales bacterium]
MKRIPILLLSFAVCHPAFAAAPQGEVSVASYPSIHEAINANPGRMIFVPAGDHTITEKIRIRGERAGLYGPGRIIQLSANQPVIEIEGANGAEIRDLTLTRPEGKMETDNEGILAVKCRDLVIENVRVIDNRTRSGAILLRECQGTRVSRCLVRNYMRVTVDDRTASKEWGYAFNCTDGTGIGVTYCTGTLIEGSRVIEENLIPTPEIKARHKLGVFVKKNPQKGTIISQRTWDADYTDSWQQGSGIVVTAPEVSDLTRILGNHIQNAAQGIDLHCDHVIVANNIIANSFMGMKAMHGSRNVIITGNQFTKNCLWAVGLMPGAASHPAVDGRPETANTDGGSVIANNIISDFGLGDARWIWGNERSPFKFEEAGQQPDDPPLADVIVQGNIVQAIGEPRYKYAVIIGGGPRGPRGMHFSNNLLHPGTQGIANIELPQ